MKRLLVIVTLALCCSAPRRIALADANAKFLAGLPIEGTLLAAECQPMDCGGTREPNRQSVGAAGAHGSSRSIREWGPQFLAGHYEDDAPMFYMFSGPDFLYANAFFPNARTYILCGIEPVGALPDVTKLDPQVLPFALANLRKSMESVLSFSFFITKNMKTDLNQTQLNGTLPVLYVFLARAGYTIDDVEFVALDRSGNFAAAGKGNTPGVRIDFSSRGSGAQTLYYFASDLSDWAVQSNPGLHELPRRSKVAGSSLLKAASYLMHGPNFDRVRQFLLNNSSVILQDDSGIPFRYFEPNEWLIRYCRPIRRTDRHLQAAHAADARAGVQRPHAGAARFRLRLSMAAESLVARHRAAARRVSAPARGGAGGIEHPRTSPRCRAGRRRGLTTG